MTTLTNIIGTITVALVTNVTEKFDVVGSRPVPCPDGYRVEGNAIVSCLANHTEPVYSKTDKTITTTVDEVTTLQTTIGRQVFIATNWIQKSSESVHVAAVTGYVTNKVDDAPGWFGRAVTNSLTAGEGLLLVTNVGAGTIVIRMSDFTNGSLTNKLRLLRERYEK